MANIKQIFNKAEVVRYFDQEGFEKLNDIMNIVVDIRSHELDILRSWEDYFQSVNAPYAVTETVYTTRDNRYKNEVKWRSYKTWRIWKEEIEKPQQ